MPILGTGVDLAEVDRIEHSLQTYGRRFQERIFTPREIAYCERFRNRAERYAARFAAKEAGMKALGTGWRRGIRWQDIEVVRQAGGRPTIVFSGVAAQFAERMGVHNVALSITHTATQAFAQVILEG
jgi:holo-[acyl-carrier protein] synthase